MGNSNGETEPRKITYVRAGRRPKILTPLEIIPAEFLLNIGKSLGNSVVKLATPKGTINHARGNEEKRTEGKRGSRTLS
jgi:hypothetical protein